ncbi:MAG: hypothetical protein M1831_002496 [Alyxoria varia]|nr:MAG: hypothetical protein M1831_002496 [Alyxoria varia]
MRLSARLSTLLLTLLSTLTLTSAWTTQDHEIFRLRDEVLTLEGANVTFYSFLGASPSASHDDINKAYRQKSRQLHPDKAIPALIAQRSAPKKLTEKEKEDAKKKGKKPEARVTKGPSQKEKNQISKEANERYARLNLVANILRGEGRERYDYFLSNGFPRWKGTGYYYERYRPGLGIVVIGLMVVFGGAAHYGALYIGWKRHREFVERYIAHARRTAWGNDSGIPGLSDIPGINSSTGTGTSTPGGGDSDQDGEPQALNRRQKRMQEKEKKGKAKDATLAKKARSSGISRPVDGEPMAPTGPQGAKKKVIAENGKVLIVDGEGNVFLEETTADGETHELLLDPDEIPQPTISQTALVRAPLWVYSRTVGRLTAKSGVSPNEPFVQNGDLVMNAADVGQHETETLEKASAVNANAEVRKRKRKGGGAGRK